MDNDLILYTTDDGESQLVLRELGGKEYLTQLYVLPKKLQERLEQKRKDKNDHPSGPQIPENIQCQVVSASWLEFRS